MVNKLNERKNKAVLIAALISAFVFILSALVTGMVLGINKRNRVQSEGSRVARYLLADSANELNHAMSALRLCNSEQSARFLCNDGLVFAVRAETALECVNGNWREMQAKEAFLNDVATVMHTKDAMKAVKKANILYKYSDMFFKHVVRGDKFEYNGEIVADGQNGKADERKEKTDEKSAKSLVMKTLGASRATKSGEFDGKIEFEIERDGRSGYATVVGDKICEFMIEHGGGAKDEDGDKNSSAGELAAETAAKCGYPDLSVCSVDGDGGYTVVRLCKKTHGALACDDCARVGVSGGKVVAFSAGNCVCEHDPPEVKVEESEARKNAKGAKGEGVLVTRTFEGEERVCYEYRYELEDGVHYVYVCAENGEQMQVK